MSSAVTHRPFCANFNFTLSENSLTQCSKQCKIEYARRSAYRLRQSPSKTFYKGAKYSLCSLSFHEGRIGIMLTYGEIIATVALIVSIVRLVLDIIKYMDEHKKK